MLRRRVQAIVLGVLMVNLWFAGEAGYAQAVPTADHLQQLVAPFALFPDALVAQITAASTDPQQIHDVDLWMRRNSHLEPQALTDAAQQQGFDPAFISLVNFPTVIDMMAANLDNYAALGDAFRADPRAVETAIQTLRQDAFARGVLDSNEYQTVVVEQQNNVQVVVIQPANPQIVFVPVYQPQVVWASGPTHADVVAASLISFSAGIAMGAWLNNSHPWGWGVWGWGWGGRGIVVQNNIWIVNNRWRSPHPSFRPRPPRFNHPVHARPPSNWNQRPGWRPPPSGWRPDGPNNGRPGGNAPGNRPPGNSGGNRPGGNTGNNRPGGGTTGTNPPGGNTGGNRPGGNAPGGNTGSNRPGGGTTGANPPGGNAGSNRPGGNSPGGNTGSNRPGGNAGGNPQGGNRAGAGGANVGRPQSGQRPQQTTGSQPGGLGGSNNGATTRAASDRGRASAGGGNQQGGRNR